MDQPFDIRGWPRTTYVLGLTLLLGLLVTITVKGPVSNEAKDCQVSTRDDLRFLPPSELADTVSKPTVLIMENNSLETWVVPNRGRFAFKMIRKASGHNMLYSNRDPSPLEFQGSFTFEFGGVYPTFPWNERDQQPINQQFEVVEGAKFCQVRVHSTDPGTGVKLSVLLSMADEGTRLTVDVTLSNPKKNELSVPMGTIVVAQPGGSMTKKTKVLLPVKKVQIGQNEGRWMGPSGTTTAWPAPWATWGNFEAAGSFSADTEAFSSPQMAVHNPQNNESIRLSWDSSATWDRLSVFSWVPKFQSVLGAYPGFRVELNNDDMPIPPDGRQFTLHMDAQEGQPDAAMPRN